MSLSQVGIGTEFPASSAALEIYAPNKGVLIPRVSLKSLIDPSPIDGRMVEGLLVYNNFISAELEKGFYYWKDNLWHSLDPSLSIDDETITTLINNYDGTYTYTNEVGSSTVINLIDAINQYEQKIELIDGLNTEVVTTNYPNQTQYQVNVPIAMGASSNSVPQYGVIKEKEIQPEILVNNYGELELNYESIFNVIRVSQDYLITDQDAIILVQPYQDNVNINLPDPSMNKGRRYTIKKENEEEDYYVQVYGNIAGVNNQMLYTAVPHTGWTFVSDGTQWRVEQRF